MIHQQPYVLQGLVAFILLMPITSARIADADPPPEPKSFADAKAAGRDVLVDIQQLKTKMLVRGSPETGVEIVPGVVESKPAQRGESDPLQEQLNQKEAAAVRLFKLALTLADENTLPREVATVRYFLCYLYFARHEYEQAAELGEEVVREHPATIVAPSCAKIAIASYLRLYGAGPRAGDEKQAAEDRLASFTGYILDAWPDRPEAEEAFQAALPVMLCENRVDDCVAFLHKLPDGTPQRTRSDLLVGTMLWSKCLLLRGRLRQWERDGNSPSEAVVEVEKKRIREWGNQAAAILSGAVERARTTGTVTTKLAHATLSLAQVRMWLGRSEQSTALLEDARIGPLTLVNRDDPAVFSQDYVRETYKVAVRAYEAVGRKQEAETFRKLLGEIDDPKDTEPLKINECPIGNVIETELDRS